MWSCLLPSPHGRVAACAWAARGARPDSAWTRSGSAAGAADAIPVHSIRRPSDKPTGSSSSRGRRPPTGSHHQGRRSGCCGGSRRGPGRAQPVRTFCTTSASALGATSAPAAGRRQVLSASRCPSRQRTPPPWPATVPRRSRPRRAGQQSGASADDRADSSMFAAAARTVCPQPPKAARAVATGARRSPGSWTRPTTTFAEIAEMPPSRSRGPPWTTWCAPCPMVSPTLEQPPWRWPAGSSW